MMSFFLLSITRIFIEGVPLPLGAWGLYFIVALSVPSKYPFDFKIRLSKRKEFL